MMPWYAKPTLYALDMESTLTPEIWIEVAKATETEELLRTTRDEPDYAKLMAYRIEVLEKHNILLTDILPIVESLEPLPGARDFLDLVRTKGPTIIISDTFYELGTPLFRKLGNPTIFCHSLSVSEDKKILDFHLRKGGSKKEVVTHLQDVGFEVCAIGDSHNDTEMMKVADSAYFMHAPESVAGKFPQFKAFDDYETLSNVMT